MKKDDLDKLYIDVSTENQKFLNKAIFAFSMLAIPFLLETLINNDLNKDAKLILNAALLGFISVIVIQILSFQSARKACDNYFEEQNKETNTKKTKDFFRWTRLLNLAREGLFIISIIIVTIGFVSLGNQEKEMSDNKKGVEDMSSVKIKSITIPKNIESEKDPQIKPPEQKPAEK